MSVSQEIDSVMENLIMLCEIRGQLSPEANLETETKIASLKEELAFLNTVIDFDKNFAILNESCDL